MTNNKTPKDNIEGVLHRVVNKWWNMCILDPSYENQLEFERELNTKVQAECEKYLDEFVKSLPEMHLMRTSDYDANVGVNIPLRAIVENFKKEQRHE